MRFRSLGHPGAEHISTWTSKRELVCLYRLASSLRQDAVVLEIGSHLGASACYLAAGIKKRGGHLYCVDTWQNETMPEGPMDTYAAFRTNVGSLADVITMIRKPSGSLTGDDIQTPIDLAFIDGDHSYDAVATDFALISPWMAQNGIVAFHDVGVAVFPGVGQVFGEAVASGGWRPEGAVKSLAWLRRA
jgi:predicted O-methyltransferase YrrM